MSDDAFEMDDELLTVFLEESNEGLESLEQSLMELESDPANDDLLASVFRTMHTIKGNSGFLGLERLGKIAHAGEDLLSKMRAMNFPADENIVSLLLETSDAIRSILTGVETEGTEPEIDHEPLVRRLKASERLLESLAGSATSETPPETKAEPETEAAPVERKKEAEAVTAEPVEDVAEAEPATTDDVPAPLKPVPAPKAKKKAAAKPQSGGSIRVDLGLLDAMMNQISELVLSRNRLMQLTEKAASPELINTCRDINQVTEHLQEQLLRTRMQPISTIWGTIPRIVRDIGKQLGKKIRVVMEGQDTELDRTILAALKDPLTHIIRNSCDHGVESPEKRRQAGKPIEGTLNLLAKQESGFIIITIEDDGGGINPEIIKAKAVSMGVLNERQAENISDNAALQLIFNAGLSTAEKVSDLSGRGVGMDVVRTEIEKVGGSVDIQSEVGSGTALRIRIPLTLAIIPTMIVGCGEQRFAVPQMNVKELMAAHADSEHWQDIAGSRFFRVRGKLLPIVNLNDTLKLGLEASKGGTIVLIDTGERTFGIAVDRIYGAEEIVVKALGMHFQNLEIYGGCSILGDGSVVPILECNALGNLLNLSQEAEAAQMMDDEESDKSLAEIQHTLVFIHGMQSYAIPLVLVERLEQLTGEQIERSGEHEILQYRGQIIPVLRWKDVLGIEDKTEEAEHLTCLILSDGNKRMCLQVERIGEILEIPMEVKMPSDHPLFLGTTVIEGKATEIVDIYEVIKRADPGWFNSNRGGKHKKEQKHILFAEDAPFFRGLLAPMLEAKGYDVWIARDGVEACTILENRIPDLLLTDLEMPNMDGYELAAWVRNRPDFANMPIVALTSNPPDESETEKRACFDAIMTKEDRPTLLDQFGEILGTAHAGKKADIIHDISPEQSGSP